jgi:chitodextrinase
MNRSLSSFLLVCLTFLFVGYSHHAAAQSAPAWAVGVSYTVGEQVTYDGATYQCIQANTSEPGWDPPAVPALWELVSASSCSAAPSVPGGLAASGTTSTSTALTWSASTVGAGCSLSGYTVYENGAAVASVSSGTSYTVMGLSASTAYSFSVAASDSFGASSQSAALSVTTSASSCSASPSAPSGLAASGTTSSGTTLSWTAPSVGAGCSISSYTVYENGAAIATVSSGTSYAVSGLSPSTAYSFSVAATDAKGSSSQSTTLSVTTAPASGSGCAAAWSATTVYTAGMQANVGGINYVANYWTEGNNPATSNGVQGSGQPWTSLGACSTCTTVPTTPSGLAASGTTYSSTSLSWSAATVPSNCSVSGYTIYENGSSVGTSTSTSFTTFGLSASTKYSFTVAAKDTAGTSPQSAAVSVTTSACTGSCSSTAGKLFAPYIDMSLTTDEQIITIQQQSGIKAFSLAFLDTNGSCAVGWGGLGGTLPTDTLPNGTTIASLVTQLQSAGVTIIPSFGGANGSDPAGNCGSASALQAVYQQVINLYHVNMLDFDIESSQSTAQLQQRDQALIALKNANPGLIVSLTLPVLPTGLITAGTTILSQAKSDGFNPDVINVMAMDYGSAVDNGAQMGLDATDAASATHAQVQAAGLSSTIGVTPMIGVNNTATEIFQLTDATTLLNFANSNSYITRLSMWSVARDNGSCAGAGYASPVCSAITQSNYAFSDIFEPF